MAPPNIYIPKKSSSVIARRNAKAVLQNSTLYPFRIQGKTLICVYCLEDYDDPQKFRDHHDNNHRAVNWETAYWNCKDTLKVDCTGLQCRHCEEPFERIEDIALHIKENHDVYVNMKHDIALQPYKLHANNWECYNCKMKLPSLTTLCRHTTTHYMKHTCETCGRSYMTREALKYHKKCNHSGENVCRKCWRDFPSLEEKRQHVKDSKSCWAFCCIYCGERFMSWETKIRHLQEVHGQAKTIYSCPECSKIFDSRSNFYSHYKVTHTNEGFHCSGCNSKFDTRKKLEDHKLRHTEEKKFQCNVCSKLYSRAKSLKQHMWIHSEVKRFMCVICQKQFAQKVSLKGHLKSHHPDLKIDV